MRMIVSESNVVVLTVITLRVGGFKSGPTLSVMDRGCMFRGRFEWQIQHTKGRRTMPARARDGRGSEVGGLSFSIPVG
jgi:hypothetical protein